MLLREGVALKANMSMYSSWLPASKVTLSSPSIPRKVEYRVLTDAGTVKVVDLAASIVSSLENIGGALVAIIIYYYYLLTGYILPSYEFGVIDFIATVSIIIGVILLGRQEQSLMKQEAHLSEDKKKHRLGALALFFPIIYTLIDVFSLAEIGGVSGNNGIVGPGEEVFIPAMDFFIFECAGIAIISKFLSLIHSSTFDVIVVFSPIS